MQTNLVSWCTIVAMGVLSGTAGTAQNQSNVNDLKPQNIEVQRSDSSQKPEQLPPIQPAGLSSPQVKPSIVDNDLRGRGVDPKPGQGAARSDFSTQPQPPSPISANTTQGSFSESASQDPLEALNPSRLPVVPQRQPAVQRVTPANSHPSASSIPTTTSSTRRSIMTPTTGDQLNSQPIVPAGFENQAGNNTITSGPNFKQDIKSLISEYSVDNSQQPLPGIPKPLEELLRTTAAKDRQNMVQQYWETYFDWATLQNRQRFENWLGQIRSSQSQTDQWLLQTARSMASNETLAAEIQLARSQSRLQEVSRTNPAEMLPLPANDPVTSRYITHFEWYETRQMVPPKLKGINEILPRTYQLLTQRAETVGHAAQARNQAVSAYSSGQTDLAAVLHAGHDWNSSLQGMVATVVSYNKAISDYALTITPPQKPISDIVSMLIPKPKAISAVDLAQPNQPNVAGNPYSQRPLRPSTGTNGFDPNAGTYPPAAATQQPAISPARRPTNDNTASRGQRFQHGSAASSPAVANQPGIGTARGNMRPGLSPQPDRSNNSLPAATANRPNQESFGSGQQFGGPQNSSGPQNNRNQNNPQQTPGNRGQMFRGGNGGSFGG